MVRSDVYLKNLKKEDNSIKTLNKTNTDLFTAYKKKNPETGEEEIKFVFHHKGYIAIIPREEPNGRGFGYGKDTFVLGHYIYYSDGRIKPKADTTIKVENIINTN